MITKNQNQILVYLQNKNIYTFLLQVSQKYALSFSKISGFKYL